MVKDILNYDISTKIKQKFKIKINILDL